MTEYPALDVEAWEDAVTDDGILITDGRQVTITVRDGHLVIVDGVPSQRRERRLSRAKHQTVRVVNLGRFGYVTFEAQRWMQACGISFTSIHEPLPYQDWRAICGQVQGSDECVRYLIGEKIRGQAENLWLLDSPKIAQKVQDKLKWNEFDPRMRNAEIGASMLYWNTWVKTVQIPWKPADQAKIPEHWEFKKRGTDDSTGTQNQNAKDPLNAMLNYGYRIGEHACYDACVASGLNPVIGVLHPAQDDRSAFALDVLEAIRPEVDRRIIRFLRMLRGFDRRWLHEKEGTSRGVIVLDPPLTHRIAGWQAELFECALPVAAECARILRREFEGNRRS